MKAIKKKEELKNEEWKEEDIEERAQQKNNALDEMNSATTYGY